MGRTLTVLQNFASNFLLGFVVGALVRDRRTGVRAGLALGLVAAAASWLLYDRFAEMAASAEEAELETDRPAEETAT